MRIGITTLHNYNFGSALQCYATQEYLKGMGGESEVIDIAGNIDPTMGKACTLLNMASLCLKYPRSVKAIMKLYMSQRGSALSLTTKSLSKLHRFNNVELKRGVYTKKDIEQRAESAEFNYFFTGSDQVWNGARVDDYYKFFLRFAPKEKRVAWAASFGGKGIAEYNLKRYKRYIEEFEYISVREKSGVDIVNGLTGKTAACLTDPVMLLEAEEWRKKLPKRPKEERYILAFFIDSPSEKAVENVLKAQKETGLNIVSFGYRHPVFADTVHQDGGPFDFLAAIDGAEHIFTDSFHAMVFSTLFHKSFYIYERMYVHNQNQSTRVTDLLADTGNIGRFNKTFELTDSLDFSTAETYFQRKRQEASDFLRQIVGEGTSMDTTDSVKEEKSRCCGCGACVDICKHDAIAMVADDKGIIYPRINRDKCVDCGLCNRVCSFGSVIKTGFTKEAYIAASKDLKLIEHSASGGIFATVAKHVLDSNGIVYGASLWIEDGKVRCEHIGVERTEDLYKIQGSKYVQSYTQGIFPMVKNELNTGRLVLFSGTSCQVAALKGFLRKDYDNLFTVDLICHGVPGIEMLQDYIDSLSLKDRLVGVRFRKRTKRGLPYTLTLTLTDRHNNTYTKAVSLRKSAYYRLFMSNSGYRPSCYDCPYATIEKPGDITLGDFYLNECANREAINPELKKAEMLSSMIVQSQKGKGVIYAIRQHLDLHPMDIAEMQAQHGQLNSPSIPTRMGESLLALYHAEGFKAVQKAIDRRNRLLLIPSIMKRIMRKLIGRH